MNPDQESPRNSARLLLAPMSPVARTSKTKKKVWDGRIPVGEEFNPLVQSEKLKNQQMKLVERVRNARDVVSENQKKLNLAEQTKLISIFPTSMKAMDTPQLVEKEKFPKHQIPNIMLPGGTGFTISSEPKGDAPEAIAELEVLKAILNRVRLYILSLTSPYLSSMRILFFLLLIRRATLRDCTILYEPLVKNLTPLSPKCWTTLGQLR